MRSNQCNDQGISNWHCINYKPLTLPYNAIRYINHTTRTLRHHWRLDRNSNTNYKERKLIMGFFSWNTQDTNRSIVNFHSNIDTFKVIMTDNKENQWIEENYEGYGVFGGKDYFALLDEMNGGTGDRSRGIDLYYSRNDDVKYPSLSECGAYFFKKPEDCKEQGYFYDENEMEY